MSLTPPPLPLQCPNPLSTVVLAVEQTTFSVCALPPSSSSSSLPQPVLCSLSWPDARPGFMFQNLLSSQSSPFPSTNSSLHVTDIFLIALPSTLDLVSSFVLSFLILSVIIAKALSPYPDWNGFYSSPRPRPGRIGLPLSFCSMGGIRKSLTVDRAC